MPPRFPDTRRNWPRSPPDVILVGAGPWGDAAGEPSRVDRVPGRRRPVGGGLVDRLARPGGNATGFMAFEYRGGKWMELLKQIAPVVTRAPILRDPAQPAGTGQFGAIQAAAPRLLT
jgi:hypothetical protein